MAKQELPQKFMETQSLMRRYMHREMGKQGQMDPHHGQGRILMILGMKESISQKDLAFILGVRPQSIGELLGKMEKQEWITRTASEEDRRVMLVSLTEKGQEEAKRMTEQPHFGTDLFSIFNEEEQEQLVDFFERLIEELEEKVGNGDEDERKEFIRHFGGGHGGPRGHHGGGPFGPRRPHHHDVYPHSYERDF
ncbi:MarR family winged helix-turn-helix transcriptional regulator [Enterococcus sp. AZ194]|uniref:MarR family winged helix-turn-helix transcriptional regulator n=1 Tax=Enterococcus sp. AZ194 TaxID=2774629 RepID=UPI003F682B32